MKRLTQEEYEKRIYDLYNEEYSVIGKYVSGHTKIKIKHNFCDTEFDVDPCNIMNGKSKCPVCYGRSKGITHDIFIKKISNLVGDEYSVMSEYKGANTPIKMKHNKCSCKEGFYEWEITPHNFMDSKHRCPYESHQNKYNIDIFKERLFQYHPEYKCIDKDYINSGTPIQCMCDQGHIFGLSLDNIKKSCPYCNNSKLLIGKNDLWTTNPDVAQYLVYPEKGYSIRFHTHLKEDFKCPFCGSINNKVPFAVLNKNGKFVCENCGDGVSYPEKFFRAFLDQLNIQYKYQLNRKDFDWCGDYRYDFYLYDYKKIIEVHGRQHYEDSSRTKYVDVHQNDINKKELAIQNGYEYLEIDARYSKMNYIRDSILSSELVNLYDLTKIDWEKCDEFAKYPLALSIKQLQDEGKSGVEIQRILQISEPTFYKYRNKVS